jgi:ketosteroid isomerase-like protein
MKSILTAIVVLLITSALFVTCNNDAQTASSATEEIKPAFDIAATKKAIEEANTAYADLVKKSDSTGLAAMYSTDAKMLPSNMPAVTGRKNMESVFAGMLQMVGGLNITTLDVWGTADFVAEEGTLSILDKAGKEIDKGKYIALWKMEDGKWKIFRDCFNSDQPLPGPTK